jgi:hypothetical protein
MARRPRLSATTAALAALSLSACGLLEVDYPGTILDEDLQGPEGLGSLYVGVLYDFASVWNGELVLQVGLLSDEFVITAPPFIQRHYPTDQRDLSSVRPAGTGLVYVNAHRLRVSADRAAERFELNAEDPEDPRLPELLTIAGFAYVELADDFCEGVPLGSVEPDGSFSSGLPTTSDELREAAVIRFERALMTSAASGDVGHFARLGYARALVGLGRYADAAAAAGLVPTGYAYRIGHTQEGVRNQVYHNNGRFGVVTVADLEGGNGLPYRSQMDPRVPWVRSPADAVGFDRQTPLYQILAHDSYEAPTVVATGAEARLIEAEAALANGDAQWLVILQDLRAESGLDFTGVPLLQDQGSTPANVDLLFAERAFWMYGTGRRLGDMRRLMRQYGRLSENVFPTGPFAGVGGGFYGASTSFPITAEQQGIPNFTGCVTP